MSTNGNGSGPTWKGIGVTLIGVLIAALGWWTRGVAQDVRENDRRIQALEVLVARDLATIKTELSGIRTMVATGAK
jgi:hypothetical protein